MRKKMESVERALKGKDESMLKTGVGFFGLVILLVNVAIFVAGGYVVGSLVTSTVKSFKNECNKKYGIERYVDGNWFCEVKSL